MTQMPTSFDHLPLCDRVRESCRWVSEHAQLVTIDDHALARLGGTLDLKPTHNRSTPPSQLSPAQIDEATLVLALDAINFGSGYHDVVRKRPGLSGSRTMAAALEDYVQITGRLTPDRLGQITIEDCSQIFSQELDGGVQEELMSLFAAALCDLGRWLDDRGGAGPAIASARASAEAFADSLTDMLFFRDVERYRATTVSFYKRAQITPADLARRVHPGLFTDLHRLTAFADNLVPHVLRMTGVLAYDADLSSTVDRRQLLEPGGQADVEIRAAGVECVERLVHLTGATAMDLDERLWTLGGAAEMKATPRHRARTVFY